MSNLPDVASEITETLKLTKSSASFYSGEPIEFEWTSKSALNSDIKFALKCPGFFNEQQDIMPFADSEGNYTQKLLLETAINRQVDIELIIALDTEYGREQQQINLPSAMLKPAEIESFETSKEVALGDANCLSWKSLGKISTYELKIGDQDWLKLPANTTSYTDFPTTMTQYQLRGYQDLPEKGLVLVGKSPSVNTTQVYYPEKKPVTFYPKTTGVAIKEFVYDIVLSPDDSKLYIARDKEILVLDTVSGSILMSITASIQPGPKIIALSSDGSKLYVADTKTRSLLVFFTHEGTLEKIISIKIIPKIMIFSLDKQKLYIGGGSAIAVVDISINEFVKKVDIEIAKINICGLAFFSNSLLYVSNANDKQVLKINVSEMSDDKPLKIAGDKVITVGENPHAIVKGSSNIYVLNTGSNSVSVIDPSTDPIDFKIKCDNPESMVLSADSARLYIAGGFTNKIVSYDIVKKSLDTIDVGLNPRKIVLGNNGARIYTICFDGVVSFWTEKRYIRHDKILIPLATKKNKDPFAEAEDSAVMRRQAQTQAEIKAIDAELRAGPYGMFQGKDVSRSSDNFADPSVKSGQHFKADQSPKGDKLNSLVNNGSVSKSVKKDELTKSKFKLSQKLQNYKITTSTEDESIFISMELLKANFSGSSGSTPGCFSCFNKLGGQAKTREAIMNQDAQLISERLKVLLEDIATVNLTSTEVPVLVISSLTKDTTEVIKVLEAIGIAVNQSTATLRNK